MELIIVATLFLIVITLIYIYLKRAYFPSPGDLPGVKPHIFFGNLINSGVWTGESAFHQVLLDYQHHFGDKFQYWLGSHRCLVFCRIEHAQTIFADRHTFENSPLNHSNFDLFCPNAIATLTGAKWQRHIRILLPMLKLAKIIGHLETIVQCADRFIDQNLHSGQVHRDLVSCCESFAMNVIGFIGFGCDFDIPVNSQIKKAVHDFESYAMWLLPLPSTFRWVGKIYLKYNWKYQRAYQVLHGLTQKLVEEEQKKQSEMENERPNNLIASLVSSLNEESNDEQVSSGLTSAEIFDEILTMILFGYEASSPALLWFIFFASKNPQVQQKMKEELREHHLLMTNNLKCVPPLTANNLSLLTYCECVTKEVLRLAPIIAYTIRIATCNTIVDDVKIHCGQNVFIPLHNININARYWHHADPQQFIPERFLVEDKIIIH